ncbi:hypothetical protein [Acinetobacter dispersus]|uniref:hypothetical protein n=1 Tax=Acinetobacter dispersus TaxID=70348 RepID=UPI00132EFE3C|nr:hypothetical protein [Acinetobacter dispersus]QHH96428.1 hypothetical protein FPL17_02320 [Acinetobacter dispersus]
MKKNISLTLTLFLLTGTVLTSTHAGLVVEDTTIIDLFIHGGTDTANPGTSCIKISSPVSAACKGLISIPNNNKPLLAAALSAQLSKNKVWFYYDDNGTTSHCPGVGFTPCSLISLSIR